MSMCNTCFGSGYVITCIDDICNGLGYCIHGDGEDVCPECDGEGDVVDEADDYTLLDDEEIASLYRRPTAAPETGREGMTDYIHENLTYRLIGDHPHAGELCHPVGDSPQTITRNFLGQYRMHLIDCPDGISGCYADMPNLERVDTQSR